MITTPISSTPQSGRKRPVVTTTDDELPEIPYVSSDQESGQASFLTPEPAAKRRPHRTASGGLTGLNSDEDRDHERSGGSASGSKGDDEIDGEHDPNSVFTPGTNTAHLLLHLRRKWFVGNGTSLGGNGKPSCSSPTLIADGALISDSPATADVTDDNDTPVRAADHPIADHRVTVGVPSPTPVATSLFTKKEEQPRTATSNTPVKVSTGAGRSRETGRANVSSSSTGTSKRKIGSAQKPMGKAEETTPRSKAAGVGISSGQTKSPVGVLSEGRSGSAGGGGSSGTLKHRTATRERSNGKRGCTPAPGGGKGIKGHGNGNPTLGRGRGSMEGVVLESTTTATCQQPLRPVQSATSVSLTGNAFPCGVLGIAFPVGGKGGAPSPEGCSCKKSLCLKLYCQCFAAQMLCHQSCKCENCYNNVSHSMERQTAIRELLCRSPHAFDAKFCKAQVDTVAGGSGSGSVVVHNTGCGCSKSACLKRYCECFNGGIACSDKCRCKDCRNTVDAVRARGGRSRSGVTAAAAVAAIAQGSLPGQQRQQQQHVAASRASVGVTTYTDGHAESRGRRDDGNAARVNVDREGRRLYGGENVLNGSHGRDSGDAAERKEGYRSSGLQVASSSGSTGRSPLGVLPGFGSGLRDGVNQGARV